MLDMARLPWLSVLCLTVTAAVVGQRSQNRAKCKIKAGVISNEASHAHSGDGWKNLVMSAWHQLKSSKNIADVDMQFINVRSRTEFTMDMLIEAYMEIGTTNISAMIGPYVVPLATATEKFGIPYFVTSPLEHHQYRPYNMISIAPDPMDIVFIATEVAKRYKWDTVAVIYDSAEGTHLIEQMVLFNTMRIRSWKVANQNGSDEELRESLLTLRDTDVPNIVLSTSRILTSRILNQALHLSMLTSYYWWVIPNLAIEDRDIAPYAYTRGNFTTFKLVEKDFSGERQIPPGFSRYEFATVTDSLLTLYHGVRLNHWARGSCHWSGRGNILSVLPKIGDIGATGRLTFRQDGRRRGYIVDVLGLGRGGLEQVGFWNSSETNSQKRLHINLTVQKPVPELKPPAKEPLRGDHIKIVMILESPFVQRRQDHHRYQGNLKYEGFCIDLVKALSELLGFTFELYNAPGGRLGTRLGNGSWDGLVGQVANGTAAFGIGPIMTTSDLEEVVDFTKTFKTTGLSVVLRRPRPTSSLFLFLNPLSPLVWIVLLGVLALFSITFYVIDRVAPAFYSSTMEVNHVPPSSAAATTSSTSSVAASVPRIRLIGADKSVWFTFTSMVLRTVDINPRTISGRILAGALWFFSLMVISSYTANLAALLTVSSVEVPTINSLRDLAAQNRVQYGTVRNSHVTAFLERSRIHQYQSLWHAMSTAVPSVMVNSAEAGFERVQANSEGSYAFIWESSSVRQRVNENCELLEIVEQIDLKSFAIAVPQAAPYRDMLSMALLRLAENGRLHEMEVRWWPENKCPDTSRPTLTSQSLSIRNMAGIFIFLALGILVAIFVSIIEYACRTRRKKVKTKNRKVPEEGISAKPLCDGNVSAGAIQMEETQQFMTPVNYSTSKQTNIF